MNTRFIVTALVLLIAAAGLVWFIAKSTTVTKTPATTPSASFTATPDQPGQTRIRLFGPTPGSVVTSPLVVYGQATNLYQDTLTYKLTDAGAKVVTQGSAKTDASSTGQYANFQFSLTFTAPATATGTLELTSSSNAGATLDRISIPVKFR